MSIKMSESINELAKAYAQFQAEVRNPSNTAKNPQFKSNYAPLDEVINTAKPVLAKYGLSVLQSTGSEGESVKITSILLHQSGQYIQSDELTLPAYQIKGGGVKDFNAQGAGSAITYGRRYSLSALLGLSSEDDDDGNGASGGNYRDSSSPTPPKNNTGANSDAEKEKRKQEAIARAQAKSQAKEESKATTEASAPADEPNNNDTSDVANAGQIKAVNNLLNMTGRKKPDFNKDAFLEGALAEYGVAELESISSDNAKDLIGKLNAEMRG
jgi:hypothetical protein